jgi:hypothetical protein
MYYFQYKFNVEKSKSNLSNFQSVIIKFGYFLQVFIKIKNLRKNLFKYSGKSKECEKFTKRMHEFTYYTNVRNKVKFSKMFNSSKYFIFFFSG